MSHNFHKVSSLWSQLILSSFDSWYLHAEHIPSSSKSVMSMVSESFPDDTPLLITGSDENSDLGISLQRTDLEINQKSSELDPGLMQEEQGIKALGDGYFIFQLDEE